MYSLYTPPSPCSTPLSDVPRSTSQTLWLEPEGVFNLLRSSWFAVYCVAAFLWLKGLQPKHNMRCTQHT